MEHNKDFVKSIIDRMKTVLGVARDKQVAEHFAGSRSNVSAWKRRGAIPFAECLEIAQVYGVSLDWLILGKGDPGAKVEGPEIEKLAQLAHLCVVPAFTAAGFVELPTEQWWSLPTEWLEREGLSCGETVVVRAVGDSMAGTIEDGQMVIVDLRPRDVDGVYLVRIGGVVRFKRLQRMWDGSVRMSSDNQAYAVDVVAAADVGSIEFIGYCHAAVQSVR